jgi:hypothetical protein
MAITVVNTTKANALSFSIPATTQHNCLVVCINAFGNGQSVSGVTIGGSADHFASAANVGGGIGTNPLTAIWVDRDCVGGQTAIVVSGTLQVDTASGGVTVFEISGLDTVSPLDLVHTGGITSSASFSSGATGTTSQASEIWVGAADVSGSPTGPSSPWVNTTNTGGFAICGTNIVSSTGTATYAGTATSGPWTAAVITLKAAAAAAAAPFAPPSRAPRGAPGARRGAASGSSSRGAPFVQGPLTPAPFTPPRRAPRGAAGARRGRAASSAGAPVVPTPAPFTPPRRAPRGAAGAGRGRASGSSSAGAPVVPTPAPFTPPRRAPRGAPGARRGRASGSSSRGIAPPPPPTPKQLLISLASAAGTDDYGTNYPQGILATAGVIEGPEFVGTDFLINSSGMFLYAGTPASGNLVAWVAQANGTDAFGNAYSAGFGSFASSPDVLYTAIQAGQALFAVSLAAITGGYAGAIFQGNAAGGELVIDSGGQTALDGGASIVLASRATAGANTQASIQADKTVINNSGGPTPVAHPASTVAGIIAAGQAAGIWLLCTWRNGSGS